MKKALKWAAVTLLVLVVAIAGLLGFLFSKLPKRGPDRIVVAEGVVGVFDGTSYAWIIRTTNGAALIDAGMDAKAKAILAELKAQGVEATGVHTILVTHGHGDHFGGAAAFPKATVWMAAADEPLANGSRKPAAFGPKLLSMFGSVKPPPKFEPIADGQTVVADGTSIQTIPVPGHTPGSTMFIHRDVLYTGDSLFGAPEGVALAPDIFEEDAAQNRQSLAKVAPHDFSRIADGHTGLVADAKSKLTAFLR